MEYRVQSTECPSGIFTGAPTLRPSEDPFHDLIIISSVSTRHCAASLFPAQPDAFRRPVRSSTSANAYASSHQHTRPRAVDVSWLQSSFLLPHIPSHLQTMEAGPSSLPVSVRVQVFHPVTHDDDDHGQLALPTVHSATSSSDISSNQPSSPQAAAIHALIGQQLFGHWKGTAGTREIFSYNNNKGKERETPVNHHPANLVSHSRTTRPRGVDPHGGSHFFLDASSDKTEHLIDPYY